MKILASSLIGLCIYRERRTNIVHGYKLLRQVDENKRSKLEGTLGKGRPIR